MGGVIATLRGEQTAREVLHSIEAELVDPDALYRLVTRLQPDPSALRGALRVIQKALERGAPRGD